MKAIIAVLGWLLWNLILLRLEKDKLDDEGKDFSVKAYAGRNWDNWCVSLIAIPLLLILGQEVLHVINITETSSLTWNDSYYAGAGFFTEALILALKKWFKKKQSE